MQSPISLSADEASLDSALKPLEFSKEWTSASSGIFQNVGHTVQFSPQQLDSTTITNMCGVYQLQQFHLHWGAGSGRGSEHALDGRQAEAEIHFVLSKKDETNTTRRDYLTVIGVLFDEYNGAVSGPWDKLDVTAVQQSDSKPVEVSGFVLSEFLPKNKSYYYYQGSLTTPPYSEVVQWFVMKEKMPIPSAILVKLRNIQGKDGLAVMENFRALQPVGDRMIVFHDFN